MFLITVNHKMKDAVMRILKILAAMVIIATLVFSCAAESEKLKKESKEAYPNQEWRRPPAHWAPP